MTIKPDHYSDDFATARNSDRNTVTDKAWKAADDLGLTGTQAENFTQGFIHHAQGRADLYRTGNVAYDLGYMARKYAQEELKSKAHNEAAKRNFSGLRAQKFKQGYIHNFEGRDDEYKKGSDLYDFGYELARDHQAK